MKLKFLFALIAITLLGSIEVTAAKSSGKADRHKIEYSEIEYVEPVSGTIFHFPQAAVSDSSHYDYRKLLVETPKTWISVWSTPNQDKNAYSWKKINEFDANNRFGSMTYQTKIENVDGWLRYYKTVNKNVASYYSVALIRGNAYALYLIESAGSPDHFTLPDILANAQIGKIEGRVNNDGKLTFTFWMLILAAALLSGVAKLIFFEEHNEFIGMLVSGAIVIALLFVILYWVMLYSIGTSLLWAFLMACVWVGVGAARNWTDFFNFISKALNNA